MKSAAPDVLCFSHIFWFSLTRLGTAVRFPYLECSSSCCKFFSTFFWFSTKKGWPGLSGWAFRSQTLPSCYTSNGKVRKSAFSPSSANQRYLPAQTINKQIFSLTLLHTHIHLENPQNMVTKPVTSTIYMSPSHLHVFCSVRIIQFIYTNVHTVYKYVHYTVSSI